MTQDIECTPGNDCKNVDQGPHNQNKSNTLPIKKVVTEETQAKQTLVYLRRLFSTATQLLMSIRDPERRTESCMID